MIWECHTLTTNPGDTFPLQGSTRLGIKLRGGEPRLRTFPLEDKLYFTLFQKLGPFNPGLEREFQNGGGNASHRLPPRGCPKPQGRMNWDRLSIPCYFFFWHKPSRCAHMLTGSKEPQWDRELHRVLAIKQPCA